MIAPISGAVAAALVITVGWMLGWPAIQQAAPPAPQLNAAAIDDLTARVAGLETKTSKPAAPVADPDFYYVLFSSKNFPPEGQNRGYYSNPRVDQLLLEGRSTFDRAKRKPKYEEVQKIIATELPYISLYMQSNVAIMRNNIDGYVQYPAGFYLSVPQMSIK